MIPTSNFQPLTPIDHIPSIDTLLILGSGMSDCFVPDELEIISKIETTVDGHDGRLALLHRNGHTVLISLGRRHLYEGCSVEEVQRTVRLAAELGARNLIVTNAAGGLNPRFRTGDIMLVNDCIGMMLGKSIASGATDSPRAGRKDLFATGLYPAIEERAMERGVSLERGVYAGVPGPSYETRAEIRMLRRIGADAVGMSTVAEVHAAMRASMRVVGLSLITNTLSDSVRMPLDHSDVVEQGREARGRMRSVLEVVFERYSMRS
jgi:purine-nucleoside phosphorylase